MAQEIGLHLVFEERRVRGTKQLKCGVYVSDFGTSDIELSEFHGATTWKSFVKKYPTLESILHECAKSPYWAVYERDEVRDLYVETIEGHDGLYEYNGSARIQSTRK